MKYKDESGQWKDLVLPATGDTLPVGTVVEFEGDTVPSNWTQVEEIKPNDYTTEEQVIGTWMGKPLYRKTYELTGLINGNNDISYDGSLIDTLKDVYGSILFSGYNGSGWQPIPRAFQDATFMISIGNIRTNSFRISIGTNYDPAEKGYVTLEYTKTTD